MRSFVVRINEKFWCPRFGNLYFFKEKRNSMVWKKLKDDRRFYFKKKRGADCVRALQQPPSPFSERLLLSNTLCAFWARSRSPTCSRGKCRHHLPARWKIPCLSVTKSSRKRAGMLKKKKKPHLSCPKMSSHSGHYRHIPVIMNPASDKLDEKSSVGVRNSTLSAKSL